ncbi:BTB/POZ domain-containing protein [Glomus cerebriforme]|uniref:BTB/POZ domain-containing protein n=1 Tax=Glomus cerebriforme TaxID=658196 RepID=A0A397S5M3_9GLOM|nr:BTB/POZ domain-containing protein [Glomus cerebriforme]
MSSKFLTELSKEPNVREIHAHSNILCIRSQYFCAAFSNEWAKKEDGKYILKKQNIDPHLFDIILRFIYYGNIELKNLQGPYVLKLLIAADELNIQSLITHIQGYLIKHQTEFLQQNPSDILEIVYQHETFTDLWDFYLEKICEEPKILFDSEKFINLKAPLLELLLKRDDLNMEEIEIWDSLLKWCFAQQNVMNDPAKLSNEDITKIKNLLHRFIPLIRFYHIEPTDFFYKVYCYKEILPQDLIHDLLEFHIVPNKKPKTNISPLRKLSLKFDSTLIESKYSSIFASWIDKKIFSHYNRKNIPYEFKLLYRSRATIWIAKIQGSTKLIGGYNPLDWSGKGWKYTTDSFLFNFADRENISTTAPKLSYIKSIGADYAICCNNEYGPQMGDLNCPNSNNWSYVGYYYPNLDNNGITYIYLQVIFFVKIDFFENMGYSDDAGIGADTKLTIIESYYH